MLTAQKTTDILNILQAQGAMRLIGARVTEVDEGVVEMEVDFKPELSQQHGYFHAGIIATLVDTAGLEEAAPDTIFGRMRASSEAAVAKAEFLAAVSHELRTPLAVIATTTELLMAQDLPPNFRASRL